MAAYRFLTSWLLDAPREEVWDAIWDADSWPLWWRGAAVAEELDPGTPCGVGRRGRYEWRGRVPYRLRFEAVATVVDRPHFMQGEATGDLEGTGRWRLYEEGGVTAVVYDWDVRTTKFWMNALAPVAAPLFRWNHDEVMQAGGSGLAEHLGCRLLASN